MIRLLALVIAALAWIGMCELALAISPAQNEIIILPKKAQTGGTTGGPCTTCTALAFYVAPTGNDANAGTLRAPFATLTAARAAMQASGTFKTTYLRAGTYAPAAIATCGGTGDSCGVYLQAVDNGETWSYYPPDGYCTASITGGSTTSGNGLLNVFYFDSISNLTFNGLDIHHFRYAGISSLGGSGPVTVKNNCIHNGFGTSTGTAAISCYGCSTTLISHNVIHDIAQFGILFSNVSGNISNLSYDSNFVYNTCTAVSDCGGYYIVDLANSATGMSITNNFCRDCNTSATLNQGQAYYLDDCTSGVNVTGNIATGNNGYNTLIIHGGQNNHFLRNIIDLTSYGKAIFTYQTRAGSCAGIGDAMAGNQFENNVVIGEGGGGGYPLLSGTPGNAPTITHNDYWNYAGSAITSSGPNYTDAAPSNQNPALSGWFYTMSGSSPVLSSPVSFTLITGGWGYPGYVPPQTGTDPSYL